MYKVYRATNGVRGRCSTGGRRSSYFWRTSFSSLLLPIARGRRASRSRRTSFSSLMVPATNHKDMRLSLMRTNTGVRKARSRRRSFSVLVAYFKAVQDETPSLSHKRVIEHAIETADHKISCVLQTCDITCRKKSREQETSEQRAFKRAVNTARRKKAREQQTSEQRVIQRELDRARRKKARELQTNEQQVVEQALNTARRKKPREQQTSEQRAVKRALNTARRKIAREQLTSEQRAIQRELDRARRMKARERQTSEQRAIERAANTARRKLAREQQTSEQRAIQRELDRARRKKARERQRSIQQTVDAKLDNSCGAKVHAPHEEQTIPPPAQKQCTELLLKAAYNYGGTDSICCLFSMEPKLQGVTIDLGGNGITCCFGILCHIFETMLSTEETFATLQNLGEESSLTNVVTGYLKPKETMSAKYESN